MRKWISSKKKYILNKGIMLGTVSNRTVVGPDEHIAHGMSVAKL